MAFSNGPAEVPDPVAPVAGDPTMGAGNVRRKSWRAPVVLVATGAVCVVGLVGIWSGHVRDQKPTEVASATASVAQWRADEVGKLLPVFVDAESMKSGGYRSDPVAARALCTAMVRDVTKAMADSRPAPDSRVQQHFANMLDDYKEAGDACVAGNVGRSWLVLQNGLTEQEAMEGKK